MTTHPVLQINGLKKKFGAFTAVDTISLEVEKGEIFGFLGPNGAGKTTSIKMIAGLLLPSQGSITICQRDLYHHSSFCKAMTGYIPDRPYLYEKLTGEEYLSFIASLYTKNVSSCVEQAEYYLEIFDLLEWKNHLIEGYSHGMRQKLIMTSIFMLNQPLIVVDEPMVGLDPKSARIVKELFKTKARSGTSILLSTHSMEIAEELCDRITIIDHGSLVAGGSVTELRKKALNGATRLEDIFLELTGAYELQNVISALKSETEGENETTTTLK